MSNTIIKVENLGKQYRLGEVGTGTLTQDLNRWWYRVRGKEDPFLKVGETNDRTIKSKSDLVWALKDINFEVKQGEVLGIIGKNGAGKSTLLKILSRVTGPTIGDIKVKGRIASLLEVGTGFHPELTGRENIFLNGAILGMTKQEIKNKFDEIVNFSGVERYIDTPVKRYSSGMYVRLAFAVAAHLEPEILIVDEVLAVGDAEFQKKCLGKMKDVSGQGRTVLFVSHNMAAVKELCTKGLLLKNGIVTKIGTTGEVLREYLTTPINISTGNYLNDYLTRRGSGDVRFSEIKINNSDLTLDPSEETRIIFTASVLKNVPRIDFLITVFGSTDSTPLTDTHLLPLSNSPIKAGTILSFEVIIPPNTFRTGVFPLKIWIGKKGEMAAENFQYDCIDGLFNLNYTSLKNKSELGYDPLEPYGMFNANFKIESQSIKQI
jgi:ABC-type polysaccharide/polyol phosphate transport system ATPase subunit